MLLLLGIGWFFFQGYGPDSVLAQTISLPPSDSVTKAALVSEGRGIYGSACASCHGVAGDGLGPTARHMNPAPRDFTSGVFKFRSTPSGALPTDQDLFRTVSEGVPGTWMPAWEKLLSERQRWAVVEYLKTLVPDYALGFGDEEPLPLPGQPSGATVSEGRQVYLMLGCAKCHGVDARGDGPSAGTLTDDWDQPIRPYDFTRGGYKNGGQAEDLYRTLRTGLFGTPMPAFEPGVVVFAGGSDVDLSTIETGARSADLSALRVYLSSQPSRLEMDSMSESELKEIAERRLWSLVVYLQSLARPRDLLYRLFVEDPNMTPDRGSQ
jgi:cytochrome c oxidase cbb3-type subunit 2